MVLKDDNTLVDEREPVVISAITEENLPVTPERLRDGGSTVTIKENLDEVGENIFGGSAIERIQRLANEGVYPQERADKRIKEIQANVEEAERLEQIGAVTVGLVYEQPNISVSSSGRFSEHQTVDGPIVRQKIGQGNVEIDIEGVCTTPEAKLIDALRFEGIIAIASNRFTGEVQIASTNTSPLSDGGAMNLDGEFTHTYGLSLVGVE